MRHSSVPLVAVFAAALFLGCEGSQDPTAPSATIAAPRGALPAATQVPFKGAFSGTGAASAGGRCEVLTVQIAGTGTATHLGRFTTDQSHCAIPTSLDFTDGEFTLTAANGDQLRGTYSGELVPLEPPLFAIDGQFTFTGGTGRFANATGGGNASGVQNLATGDVTVELVGTISSIGSTKTARWGLSR